MEEIKNFLNASPFNKNIANTLELENKNSEELFDYIFEIISSIDSNVAILYNDVEKKLDIELLLNFLILNKISEEFKEYQFEILKQAFYSNDIKVLKIILNFCIKNYIEIKDKYDYIKFTKSLTTPNSLLYSIDSFISYGGYGVVLSGTNISNNSQVALKFFGYRNKPIIEWIQKEIIIITRLHKCDGVAKILGIFYDSTDGIIPRHLIEPKNISKNYPEKYPVIVMEKLCGGDVFEKIHQKKVISEQQLSTIFRNFILAVNEIHEKTDIVHCDFKTENIVFVNNDPNDLSLKIIDFGLALSLDEGEEFVIDEGNERGTPGMVAPETLFYNDKNKGKFLYSRSTDIWQAGCILYIILKSCYPFSKNDDKLDYLWRDRVKAGIFYPNPNARNLSPEANDLLSKILTVDPNQRITGKEILLHPWINNNANFSTVDMGIIYRNNITQWLYRKKLRQCLESKIHAGNVKKEALKTVLSKLSYRSSLSSSNDGNNVDDNDDNSNNTQKKRMKLDVFEITQDCFKKLRLNYVSSFSTQQSSSSQGGSISSAEIANAIDHRGMDFTSFCKVLHNVDLGFMAKKEVFDVFDDDNSNYVDYFEFLITLIPFCNDLKNCSNYPLLYFELFDIRGKGNITKSELICVMSKLLDEEMDVENFHLDEVFKFIDTSGDGLINFDEFERFINIISTSTL